jgi:alginate O-acetyltransferase complex protein AlgF
MAWPPILALSALAAAPAGELYDRAPPPDAAYVRVIHALEGGPALAATVESVELGTVEYADASPYAFVTQGEVTANFGEVAQEKATLRAGHAYSFALWEHGGDHRVLLLEDPLHTNRARGLLCLYNLSDADALDLGTTDGTLRVLTGVVPGKWSSRQVNARIVDLTVSHGERPIATFNDVRLERGGVYSVIVAGSGDALRAMWTPSSTAAP